MERIKLLNKTKSDEISAAMEELKHKQHRNRKYEIKWKVLEILSKSQEIVLTFHVDYLILAQFSISS